MWESFRAHQRAHVKKPSKLTTMIVLCVILSFILFPGLLYVCIIVGTW